MHLLTQHKPSALRGFGLAVLASIAVMLLRYSINGLMTGDMPLMAGMFAIIVTAWYGGLWPGLLATALCATFSATLFLEGGPTRLAFGDALLLIGFLLLGTVTSLLFEAVRAARAKTDADRSEVRWAREQRERSRAQARDAELRHRLVLEASFDAIYEWAVETNQMVWNEGLSTLFGYASRLVDDRFTWWGEHIHPADRERTVESFVAAQDSRRDKWSAEYRMRCADGRYVWVLDRAELVFDAGGQMTRVVGAVQDVSERRRTADTLAHFKALFEAQPAPFLVMDPELRIAAASDAYLRTTMRQRAEIVGRQVFEAFPDDVDAAGIGPVRASFERVLASGQAEQMPLQSYAVQRPATEGGGFKKIWWNLYHFPVRGPGNKIAFVVQRAEDVTAYVSDDPDRPGDVFLAPPSAAQEARNFEQAQLLAEANVRLGMVNARLAFFAALSEATRSLLDPHEIVATIAGQLGQYLAVNRCAWMEFSDSGEKFEVLGDYTDGVASMRGHHRMADFGLPALMRGASTYVMNDIEADPEARPHLSAYRLIQTRATISVPLRKDGHILAGLAVHQSRPRRWKQDEIELVEQVAERCWEALERSRAMRAVTVSEARLRGLLDAMPTKVSTTTAEGSVDYFHPSWFAYTGLRFEDVGGANWGLLFHPDDLPDYRASRQASLASGEPFTHEVRVRRHDGEYRWHLAELSPHKDAQGTIQSWVGTVTDIHDRVLAEEAVRDRARQLAFLVELSNDIQALSDPQFIVERVTQGLREHMTVNRCAYAVFEPDQDHYQVIANSTLDVASRIGRHRFSAFGANAIQILSANQPYVFDDTQSSADAQERENFKQAQAGAIIFFPVRMGERVVAGLGVHQQAVRRWTATEIELVGLAGRMCWAGMERASALRHLQASNEQLRFLARLSEAIQPLDDPAAIAQTVCDTIGRQLGVSRCTYVRVESDGEHYEQIAEYLDGVSSRAGRRHFRVFGEAWWRHLQALQALVIADVQHSADIQVDMEACGRAEIAAVLFVPLHREQQLVGVFALQHNTPRNWTVAEIEAAELTGNLCFESIKRAELAAQETLSHQRLRDILDRIPEKVVTVTSQGLVAHAGRTTLDYLGGAPGLLATDWLAIIHPEDRPRGAEMLRRMSSGEIPVEEELRLRRYDAAYRWHRTRFLPVKDADDGIGLWVGAWTDLHEIKESELRLREADRAKDEFLATLAHELRNPLAPISNAVQLLQLRGEDHKLRAQMLELMSRQLAQMVRLVDDLLDVSRITTGKLVLRNEPVRLADVVRQAAESVEPLIRTGGHQLEIVLPQVPVTLSGDATRLAQVLGNLLTNSAKYSEGPGTIHLSASLADGEVRIAVRDQGIGIAPEALPRVFDMFAQSDRALSRAQGGLGIGLSLVRRLVQMHGGRVEGTSEGIGCGSTFTIFLPLPEGHSSNAEAPASDTEGNASGGPESKCRVLVADDNDDSVRSLAALLRAWGHEVAIAHDGEEALERAAEFRPEVMVLDIGMPRRDGLETAREVRAQSWGRDVLLIALSGWGQVADRERTKAAGFDYHMVKPVDSARLEKLLEPTAERVGGLRRA